MKRYPLLIVIMLSALFLGKECQGQAVRKAYADNLNPVLDGAYQPLENYGRSYLPYPHLREADVMYKKRVWQEIDLNQKFNQPFYHPQDPINDRRNLIDLVIWALTTPEGREKYPDVIAYEPRPIPLPDDEFQFPILTQEGLDKILMQETKEKIYDENDEYTGRDTVKSTPISRELITRWQIKEDWIWDKQRSERYVRIIGIAPMILDVKDGVERGFKPLFWLYYPYLRKLLSSDDKAEVYNIFNDAQRRTYWDLFEKRYFTSYIVKEGNARNYPIAKHYTGLNALAESERIQQELFNLEHDLWHY